ncbi:hypothetical protein ACP70R_004494 [Stipagrostis hirtigluma subsp. patula]
MAGNLVLPAGGGCGVDDRLSGLPEGVLEHVLSFMPAPDAVRSSVLSTRWRGAWTRAPALNLSDAPPHQDRFLGIAGAVLARYATLDIPSLNVVIGCQSNLGPATAAWLAGAMERVVGSVSVSVTAPAPLDTLILPTRLRAKSISLTLSGILFHHGQVVLPEPGGSTSLGGLVELSLSRVRLQEGVRPLGQFLSSCCPQLRKLRLSQVSGGSAESGGLHLWPLVLHLDRLQELEVDRVESFTKMQVVSASLRVLVVRSCFDSISQWDIDTVAEISAPRLEEVSWSGKLPKHLSFLTGSGCIRRLAGLFFYLPGEEFRSTSAVRLLDMCSSADQLSIYVDIPDYTAPSRLTREYMEHVPQLPNIRVLSLHLFAVLRFISCPIAPSFFSFLRRCPNLTRLHIDLSMLHQFSRLHSDYLMVPDDNESKVAEVWQSSDRDLCREQLELVSLRQIRISGFMGSYHEMELADILFGVGAARPALERISILFPQVSQGTDGNLLYGAGATRSPFRRLSVSFDQLRRHIDAICEKVKAQFPLVGGSWEIKARIDLIWIKT